jgi:hypothetical protein
MKAYLFDFDRFLYNVCVIFIDIQMNIAMLHCIKKMNNQMAIQVPQKNANKG